MYKLRILIAIIKFVFIKIQNSYIVEKQENSQSIYKYFSTTIHALQSISAKLQIAFSYC